MKSSFEVLLEVIRSKYLQIVSLRRVLISDKFSNFFFDSLHVIFSILKQHYRKTIFIILKVVFARTKPNIFTCLHEKSELSVVRCSTLLERRRYILVVNSPYLRKLTSCCRVFHFSSRDRTPSKAQTGQPRQENHYITARREHDILFGMTVVTMSGWLGHDIVMMYKIGQPAGP